MTDAVGSIDMPDAQDEAPESQNKTRKGGKRAKSAAKGAATVRSDGLAAAPAEDLVGLIEQLTEQMHGAAAELQFEVAARIRDEVAELKKELRQMQAAGHA